MEELEEKILFNEWNQLHNIVMEFNKNSAELKKIYVGLIPTIATILYKINGSDFLLSKYYIILLFTTIIFLTVEYHYYSNQIKLRKAMDKIKDNLRKATPVITNLGIPIATKKIIILNKFLISNSIYFLVLMFLLFNLNPIFHWIK